MKRIFIYLLYFFAGIVIFVVLYFTLDAVLSRIPVNSSINTNTKNYDVFVLSNGVHTDVVFPVKTDLIDWITIFPTANNLDLDSNYQYIAIGWGG